MMRAFIYAFQGNPWNEECQAAYEGFTKLGIECVLYSSQEELARREVEDIVIGGMLMTEHALGEPGISLPNYNYPKTELFCSEVVNFVSEWRCFVRYGEIVGIQHYAGNKTKICDRKIIEAAVADFENAPAACSLDFGLTDDGRTLLVEMNDGLAIGCYGLNERKYAKFLYARWAELVCVEDPWRTVLHVLETFTIKNRGTICVCRISPSDAEYHMEDLFLDESGKELVVSGIEMIRRKLGAEYDSSIVGLLFKDVYEVYGKVLRKKKHFNWNNKEG